MRSSCRFPCLGRICRRVLGLTAFLIVGPAVLAQAVTLPFELDPAQSSLTQDASSSPLAGTLTLEVGQLPPVVANTALNVVALAVSTDGLSISLDGSLANPGLGVLFPNGTFLIPSLHLSVDGSDLTVSDVVGTFGNSAACGGVLCFETGFDVDPVSGGIVSIAVVAAVPEPGPLPLVLSLMAGVLFLGAGEGRERRA